MNVKYLFFISLLLILLLVGCGNFALEPVPETEEAADTVETETGDGEADDVGNTFVEAEMAIEDETSGNDEEAVSGDDAPAAPTNRATRFMPDVRTFAAETDAAWGAAFCPESVMLLCVRPYAIESLGDEQVLLAEAWGTGDVFAAAGNDLRIIWRAVDDAGNTQFGSDCGNTKSEASRYEAGFGYLLRHCFRNLAERPSAIELQLIGAGANFTVVFDVGDDVAPAGGYSYLLNATPLPLNQPIPIGAASVTIEAVEDLGDAWLLTAAIDAPPDNRLIVSSPEWIVIGDSLAFFTVTEAGLRSGWDEGKMGAYELVGGEIEAGASQTGTVVLSKSGPDAGLLITYGPANSGDKDAAVFTFSN